MIKISIITVVKNGLPYLKSAIQAVKEQKNYQKKEIEHVVVCSPSNDGTEDYLANVNNIKLILDRQSNNKFGSLNIGIQNCSGSIIGILHADDIFYENDTLQKVLSNFNEHTDVVYGNILFSAKNDLTKITREWISSPFNKTKLSLGWMPPHTSIFVKKKILESNLYKTNYPISGDYYFILKLFHNQNIKTKYINENITIMRTGGDSTKIENLFKKLKEDTLIVKKFYKLFYITLIFKILSKIKQFKFINIRLKSAYLEKINKIIY